MKKILEKIQNVFIHDEKIEQEQTVNYLMSLVFKQHTTSTSIQIFQSFKKNFENEIAKRCLDSYIEHTICEEYFDN